MPWPEPSLGSYSHLMDEEATLIFPDSTELKSRSLAYLLNTINKSFSYKVTYNFVVNQLETKEYKLHIDNYDKLLYVCNELGSNKPFIRNLTIKVIS